MNDSGLEVSPLIEENGIRLAITDEYSKYFFEVFSKAHFGSEFSEFSILFWICIRIINIISSRTRKPRIFFLVEVA